MRGGNDKMRTIAARQAKTNRDVFVGSRVEYFSALDHWCQMHAGYGTVCSVTEWGIEIAPDRPTTRGQRLWVADATWLWHENGAAAAPSPVRKNAPVPGVWHAWGAELPP